MHCQNAGARGRMALLGAVLAALQLVPAPARAEDPKFAYGKAGRSRSSRPGRPRSRPASG